MTINPLSDFVLSQLFTFFLLLCRFGSCVSVLPAFSEMYVMPRIRMMLAIACSVMLTPMLEHNMPAMPGSPLGLAMVVTSEIVVGLFIGLLVRTLLSSMHVAGTVIANQASLSLASIFDANVGGQSTIIANFFTITAITLVFVLNLHHLMLTAIIESYDVFPAGIWPNTMDMNTLFSRTVADAFLVGMQFAMPQVILSLIVYLVGGVIARLMPTFQVFFVAMPAQILLALVLIAVVIGPMMFMYMNHVQDQLLQWITPID